MTTTARPKMIADLPRVYAMRVVEVREHESKHRVTKYTIATFDYLGTAYSYVMLWRETEPGVFVEPSEADWLRDRVDETIVCKVQNKTTKLYSKTYTYVTFADGPGEL